MIDRKTNDPTNRTMDQNRFWRATIRRVHARIKRPDLANLPSNYCLAARFGVFLLFRKKKKNNDGIREMKMFFNISAGRTRVFRVVIGEIPQS